MIRLRASAVSLAGVATLASALAGAQSTDGALCIGKDRILRYAASGVCPAGQTPYRIPAPNGKPTFKDYRPKDTTSAVGALRARLDAAERRIQALEQSHGPPSAAGAHVVRAPFSVVDDRGRPIFVVSSAPRGFTLSTAGGEEVASGEAQPDGGVFRTSDPRNAARANLGVFGNTPQVTLRQARKLYGAFYVNAQGRALLQLHNSAGEPVAVLAVTGERGRLQLTDPGGTPTVDAGTNQLGVGVVRTGPMFACVGRMGLVVPNCIAGHK